MREYLLYIDGTWRSGDAGETAPGSPPAGETFATGAVASSVDADDAVDAAAAAWPEWAGASALERAGWFGKVIAVIGARREELARALTLDQGKPLAEAFDEVDELCEYFRMAAE